MSWADAADRALAPLYANGATPDTAQIRAAYPFGPRKYWPYKAWLKQVRRWQAAHAAGLSSPNALNRPKPGQRMAIHDPAQLSIDVRV